MALSKRYSIFCAEYIIDLNGKRAATNAGFSPKTAEQQASRLLSNVKVQEEIQRLMTERMKRLGYDADQTLINVSKFANYDIRDIVEIDTETLKGAYRKDILSGEFVPIEDAKETIIRIKELDDINAHLITKLKQGKYGLELEFPDRLKANDLLMKHFKLYADRVEHTGPNGEPIQHEHDINKLSTEELRRIAAGGTPGAST